MTESKELVNQLDCIEGQRVQVLFSQMGLLLAHVVVGRH